MGGSSSSAVRLGAARARSSVPSWPAPAPYLLVIEDAHWADEATLDLLRHIARRIHTCHALVLVTYRPEDLPAGHDLRLVMGEVATAAGVRRLDPCPRARVLARRGRRRRTPARGHRRERLLRHRSARRRRRSPTDERA